MEKSWALQDAKARFSEVVRAAEDEPQHITLRGEKKAVLLSEKEYRRLKDSRKGNGKIRSLIDVLQACPSPLEIPPRSRDSGRKTRL